MAEDRTVAVEATEARYRALKHVPSGIGFEGDGTARWPADQFTFRLIRDGAVRRAEPAAGTAAPSAALAPSAAPAANPPAAPATQATPTAKE